ncbi:TIR domain-containing protein [Streptococcus anginosus]|uniref:TIR domain-containing protein n=1 Tax=Facklamia hominis TaxID=178214 RepID=A0AAJ1V2Q0_9LACT|nr:MULTISPECIES: TIR domain-containing protein [Bacillota]MED5944175.1 TIR domain-containing protein [Streptococcus anginosus]HEN9925054.1 TIR domain-containing protein [Streptococcus agalactiae]HES0334211.1 TIR domain-containing protein [Streptococcus pyogenes]MBS5971689.1 TIR domain-containing protein [Finegoldia magna]MDK7186586.1 TIR domain-containing protein [Facklamia hominis]
MARRVFFSFHYDEDINRSMIVRNSWVTQGKEAAGFIDKAEFEKIKRNGENAVCKWIDKQLEGTSITIVLIGKETLNRPFVQYEIIKSIERGNAIIGIHIHNLRDMITQRTTVKGNPHTIIGYYNDGTPAYFDYICDDLYDYLEDNGYYNLGSWIEKAALKKGK